MTFECLLVRFQEFYSFEAQMGDLYRRQHEIDRALKFLQVQFKQAMPNNSDEEETGQYSLFADFKNEGRMAQFWMSNPHIVQQYLIPRGQA